MHWYTKKVGTGRWYQTTERNSLYALSGNYLKGFSITDSSCTGLDHNRLLMKHRGEGVSESMDGIFLNLIFA